MHNNYSKRSKLQVLSVLLLVMVLSFAVSSIQSSNAQAIQIELYYDNGIVFGTSGPGFSGVKFSLPTGVTSAKLLTVRYAWYMAGDPLTIHITGPNFLNELTTPIATTSTVGFGWNDLNVSDKSLVVSGDFCVVAEKTSEGYGILQDNSTNTGRSFYGSSMENLVPVSYPANTLNFMIRVVIEPVTSEPSSTPTPTPTSSPTPSPSTTTPSPSPTPTIPEFPPTTIIPLLAGLATLSVIFAKKKLSRMTYN